MKKFFVVIVSILTLTGCSEYIAKDSMSDSNLIYEDSQNNIVTSIEISSTKESDTTTYKKTSSTLKSKKGNTTSSKKTTTKKVISTNRVKKIINSTSTITTKFNLNDIDARNKILALKEKYPTGTSWTNDNRSYRFKASNMTDYTGRGCVAFAFMASDEVFGTLPVRKHTNFSNIRVGDIIRYLNNQHSVIVLEVKSNSIIIAEGNIELPGYNGGVVLWERFISLDEINLTGTYIYTRWP